MINKGKTGRIRPLIIIKFKTLTGGKLKWQEVSRLR